MMMNKLLMMMVVTFSLVTSSAYSYHDTVKPNGEFGYEEFLMDSYDFILETHIDGSDVDRKVVVEQAVKGMLKAFDPYSEYYTKEEFENFRNSGEGKYFGIGTQISYENDMIKLDVVFEGSPAERAGLHHGDFIFEINGKTTDKLGLVGSVKLLKGDIDTPVIVKVLRDNGKIDEITIVRGKIMAPQTQSIVLENDIIYIRLRQFTNNASVLVSQEFYKSFKNLKKPLAGIILDLRDNPGGLLNEAVNMTDLFVDNGLIVETVGKHTTNSVYAESNMIVPKNIPLVILINKRSASASEVVSGSLKDLKRATIVGTKSFGKGSVQNIIPLPHGSAIKLTIAKYYTASGKKIHGVGITPDVIAELREDYKYKFGDVDSVMLRGVEAIRN